MYGSRGYGYGYGGDPMEQVLAVLGGALVFIIVLLVIVIAVKFVARWKLLSKAGHPGWKALIPVYGELVFVSTVWSAAIFWVELALWLLIGLCTIFPVPILALIIEIGCSIALTVLNIILQVKTAKSYGQGGGFAAGLIFVYPVFIMLLAFGRSEFVGNNGGTVPVTAVQRAQMQRTAEAAALRGAAAAETRAAVPGAEPAAGVPVPGPAAPQAAAAARVRRAPEPRNEFEKDVYQRVQVASDLGKKMVQGMNWIIFLPAVACLFYLISYIGLLGRANYGYIGPSILGLASAVLTLLWLLRPQEQMHRFAAVPLSLLALERTEAVMTRFAVGRIGFFGWMALLSDLALVAFTAMYWLMLYRPMRDSARFAFPSVIVLGAAATFYLIEGMIALFRSAFFGLDYLGAILITATYALLFVFGHYRLLMPVGAGAASPADGRAEPVRTPAAPAYTAPAAEPYYGRPEPAPQQPAVPQAPAQAPYPAYSPYPEYPAAETVPQLNVARQPQAEGSAEPMPCPKCGTRNPAGAQVCSGCGAPLMRRRYRAENRS